MAYKGTPPQTYYGTADMLLDKGPGVVYWALVNAGADHGELCLRDGEDTSAPGLANLEVETYSSELFLFNPPLPYYKGLFVDCLDHIDFYTIAFDVVEKVE